MKKHLTAAVLAASLFVPGIASAATVAFDIFGGGGDFFSGESVTSYDGSGSFETSGDNGTFTLANGLLNFSLTGTETVFEGPPRFRSLEGDFSAGLADLRGFSVTLDGGDVTALDFVARNLAVPLFNGGKQIKNGDQLNIRVDTARRNSLVVVSDRFGRATGDVTIDSVTPTAAVPEPATWAMMIGGLGLIGAFMRRVRRRGVAFA